MSHFKVGDRVRWINNKCGKVTMRHSISSTDYYNILFDGKRYSTPSIPSYELILDNSQMISGPTGTAALGANGGHLPVSDQSTIGTQMCDLIYSTYILPHLTTVVCDCGGYKTFNSMQPECHSTWCSSIKSLHRG